MTSDITRKIIHNPLLQVIIGIVLINVSTYILRVLAEQVLSAFSIENATVVSAVVFVIRILAVYFAYYLFVQLFEKRRIVETSIDFKAFKEFSLGGLLSLIMIGIVFSILWIIGSISISEVDSSAPVLQSLLYHTFFAFLQDIVYFAIIFRIIEKSLGSWITVAIAAIIFGFKHMLFPGYTLWSVVAQTIEAGILFSALFILSRRIWLVFGFHAVWNFIQYGLFLGFEADNLTPLFNLEFSGSNILHGMPVGFEASIITFFFGSAVGIWLLIRAYKNGSMMPPYWKKASIPG